MRNLAHHQLPHLLLVLEGLDLVEKTFVVDDKGEALFSEEETGFDYDLQVEGFVLEVDNFYLDKHTQIFLFALMVDLDLFNDRLQYRN